MYVEFLRAVVHYMEALNQAEREMSPSDQNNSLAPYIGVAVLVMDDEPVGTLRDELDGAYMFDSTVTQEFRDWWKARPWKQSDK